MSIQNAYAYNSTAKTREVVQHAKSKALNELEFERFFEAATQIEDEYFRLQCQFAAIALGRLGLRAGELAHFSSHWVDQREKMIHVPRHQPCFDGRDGDLCSSCARLAEQMAAHNEDVSLEEARSQYWRAKTDAAARGVSYGFSARVEMIVDRFLEEWDGWPLSYQTVGRRVTKIAELTEGVDEDELTPHPLRATAATYWADRGLDYSNLMQHFGWSDPDVAQIYIETSAQATAQQLSSIHSR